jgi:putative endonuclease
VIVGMFKRLIALFRAKGVGALAEHAAVVWLRQNRGFSLVAKNWRNPRDRREEIDLICLDADVLVFVEVKARSLKALVPGFYTVDRRKKSVLRRAIRAYLRGLKSRPHTFRFDIVEIGLTLENTVGEVLHFENVPLD